MRQRLVIYALTSKNFGFNTNLSLVKFLLKIELRVLKMRQYFLPYYNTNSSTLDCQRCLRRARIAVKHTNGTDVGGCLMDIGHEL
jgi:hypothetical protein